MAPPESSSPADLDRLVAAVRSHRGLQAKQSIRAVRGVVDNLDALTGPGDDGAVVPLDPGAKLVVCGEAVHPPFVAADPHAAGIAAVLANINDLAAMGAVPAAIVNTVTAPAPVAAQCLRGMADAAAMYDVPVVGGHISTHDGEPALSAFAVGSAQRVLSATNARAGQRLVFACCLDGRMRDDFDFFTTLAAQGPRLAADVRLLAEAARTQVASAAKDVSMAGVIGSLAMLLEPGGPRRRRRPRRPPSTGGSGPRALAGVLPDIRLLVDHRPSCQTSAWSCSDRRALQRAQSAPINRRRGAARGFPVAPLVPSSI